MRERQPTSFVKNAVILSAAGLISRLIGAIYRIPLYRLISKEGIGLYQMGYYVYNVLLSISATGIPVAISKLVAEETSRKRYGEAQRIFHIAAALLTGIGFAVTLMLIVSAPFIADKIILEPRAVYPIVAVAPAIFIVALQASFRGYFQGLQLMTPTAISQLVEQLGRVVTVLVLAYILTTRGARIEYTAAAASFGAVIGAICGLSIIVIIYMRRRKSLRTLIKRYPSVSPLTTRQVMLRILKFAIPITLGAMVLPFMNGIDTALVPRRLQAAGFSPEQATGMYGDLTGAAMPLINLPSMLAYALAASLVPAISNASAKKQQIMVRMRSAFAIKLILLIGIPAGVGLHLLALPIVSMLYDAPSAAIPLEIVAFAVIFLTLHQTCSGILQGLGYTGLPVRNLLIGGLVKISLNYTLTAIPSINIRGAALASVVAYFVSSSLNVRSVCKHTGMRIQWLHVIIKPLLAAAGMAGVVSLSYNKLFIIVNSNTLATLCSVGAGALCYVILLLILRTFTKRELNLIPYFGTSISKIAEKFHLLRSE